MAILSFTQQLRRFTETPEVHTSAATLGEALAEAFAQNPRLRSYILDDQGHVRTHVAVFVDGERLRERSNLAVPLKPDSTVHVLQALSGG